MENSAIILEEFEKNKSDTIQNKLFRTAIILGVIQNAIIILIIIVPVLSILRNAEGFFMSPVFIFQIIFVRLIPVFGLIQFIRKKKIGWSLMVIFSITDVLQRFPINGITIDNTDLSSMYNILFFLSLFLLVFSATLTYLSLTSPVRSIFNVSKQRLISSIIIGMILFAVFQFAIAPYLSNLAYN